MLLSLRNLHKMGMILWELIREVKVIVRELEVTMKILSPFSKTNLNFLTYMTINSNRAKKYHVSSLDNH